MKLVTVAEMQQVEREANAAGLTYDKMMENAGTNLAIAISNAYAFLDDKSALGLVGSGNNGGDTLVALAYLGEKGWRVTAYIVRPRPIDDPLVKRVTQAGGTIHNVDEGELTSDFEQLKVLISNHALLLDGILGTGIHLPLKPEIETVLRVTQQYLQGMENPPYVVAVDCPSGVDCDTGAVAPETIPADITVTMAAVKIGLLTLPAFGLIGELQVVEIGNLESDYDLVAWKSIHRQVATRDWVKSLLPKRPLDAHKSTFGAAVVVAGSQNYTGATLLSGEAAYRIGAGWVTLAVPESLHSILAGQLPEATWILLPSNEGGISGEGVPILFANLERCTALLVGPGFGLKESTSQFVQRFLMEKSQTLPPLVFDADGLKLLARVPNWHTLLPPLTVLTPHPGEMSVLTGLSPDEIQKDRLKIATHFSQQWGHVVILKGAFTIIAEPGGQVAVIPVATPALARAGTGDVLAGLVVGLLAQGVPAFPAAVAGAWIHAQAGLTAAEVMGSTASVLAGDVLNAVINVLSDLENV